MGGGDDVKVYNPGSMDPKDQNPYAYEQQQYLMNMRDQFQANSMNAMDPNRYQMRRDDMMARNQAAISNRFASMGLAGSSTAVGAQGESDRQTGFAWDDRQMNDMMKSMQMQQGLTDNITKDIYQAQGQFGQYQDQMVQAQLQQQQQQNQMWGSVLGAAGTIGGALIAGPAGAAAGGALTGMVSGGGGVTGQAPAGWSVGNANGMYDYGYGNPQNYGYGGSY
jgi:hypothetical protein